MSKFTDHLWSDLAQEHGATLAHADRPEPGRARRLRRPRVLAGSTLALAGVGTALVLALGAASSTPAYAVTTNANGSVLVTINQLSALPKANAKLTAMGIHEQVTIDMASGAAAVSGPVSLYAGAGCCRGRRWRFSWARTARRSSTRATQALAPGTCAPASSRVTPPRATPAPGDLVRAAGARLARASAMARLTV